MRRTFAAVSSMLVLSALAVVPHAARAEGCDSKVYIFQEIQSTVEISYYPGLGCIATGNRVDARVLLPTTDSFYIRYAMDFGPDTPELNATLDGLGFQATPIKLKRRNNLGAGGIDDYVYDSDTFVVAGGAPAVGCLRATVQIPDDDPDSNSLASPGSTC